MKTDREMFNTHYAILRGLGAGTFCAQTFIQYCDAIAAFDKLGAGYGVEWRRKKN